MHQRRVHRHYERIGQELATDTPLDLTGNSPPIVVLPLQRWSKVAKHAVCAALAISDEVRGVFVFAEDVPEDLQARWNHLVMEPAEAAGVKRGADSLLLLWRNAAY